MVRSVCRTTGVTAGLLMMVVTGMWARGQRGDAPTSRGSAPSGAEVAAAARAFKPDARIEGVLVSRMAPRGVELMVGCARDPVFGPGFLQM